jgi:hypothetical protein
MRRVVYFSVRLAICLAAAFVGLSADRLLACGNCGCCRVDQQDFLAGGAAVGDVIVSEIMYNPAGSDSSTTAPTFNKEWIEIYNASGQSVDLTGWSIGDSQDNNWASPFPAGTALAPNQALVITGDAATFDAQWGAGINRIQVSLFPSLANTPSPVNETVSIRDASGVFIDSVNFDQSNGWPRINFPDTNGSNGHSIFALPAGLSAAGDDIGANWRPSTWGNYGAVFSDYNGEENHASPGYVASQEQPPFTPSPDATWSMVLMPDTQNYVKASGEKHVLTTVTEWIRDNRDEFKIQVVLHEGDIVNNNNTTSPSVPPSSGDQNSTLQWQNAQASMHVLNGEVPYIMAAGNHDFGFLNSENRETQINTYFKATDNPLVDPAQGGILQGVKTAGEIQNAYYAFTAPDGRKMLVFSLEWEPQPATVTWANQIAALPQYADHSAVLLTHAYLQGNNTRYTSSKVAADNAGSELWTNLVRQHENFEMVVNGHFGGDGQGYVASTALAGNTVNQLFFNTQFETQGGNGWIQLLEFMQDGKTVRVRTYSPYLNQMRPHPELEFEFLLSPLTFLAGDYNRDGRVDTGDYVVWRDSVGSSGFYAADGNGDQVVNQQDYTYWRFRFGNSLPGSAAGESSGVPEPSSLPLLLLAASALIRRRIR